MKKLGNILVFLLIVVTLTGCSAVMAASGKREPNISALQLGDSKNMVKAKMGYQPIRVSVEGNTTIEVYEVQFGNEASTGRAITHATLDILTLGVWEIVGTPMEGFKGEKSYLIVEYENDKLINFHQVNSIPK